MPSQSLSIDGRVLVTKLPLRLIQVSLDTYCISARFRVRGLAPAIVLLFLPILGCARRSPDLPAEGAVQTSATPFQGPGADAIETSEQGFSAGDAQGSEPPFQNDQTIPAGSLLSVRLKDPLVAGSGSKDPFEAVLDEPVVVAGNTLIPRDAIVSGEIESAHVLKGKSGRGYVCLTLNSVQLDGLSVPIQTASLFARQPSRDNANSDTIRLERGRRLTFRLKEQVFLRSNVSKSGQ